jgi:hypothetical protein
MEEVLSQARSLLAAARLRPYDDFERRKRIVAKFSSVESES